MKLILLDLLRRWGWLYLLGFILATTFNILAKYVGPFAVFTPYFLAPMLGPLFVVASDLMRGAARVTTALPVSARNVGVSYWIVGVCIPPVLLSLALIFANVITALFSPTTTTGWDQVGLTFVVSFLIAGSVFFDLTLFKTGPEPGLGNQIIGTLAGALWGVSAFSSMGVKFLFDFRKGDTVTMTSLVLVGLLFTVLGFMRSGEMVKHRARNRIARQSSSRKPTESATAPASAQSGLSGLPYMFFESIKFAFGMSVVLMFFGALFRSLTNNWMFVNYSLVICALLPGLRFFTGLRHIRSLPISIDRVAFIILALPLLNLLVCLGVIVASAAIFTLGAFKLDSQLLVTAGLASFGNSLAVRFGAKSLPWIMGIGIAVLFALTELLRNLPVAASWTVAALLMIAAYGIVRLSLRSSATYRVPAASLSVG